MKYTVLESLIEKVRERISKFSKKFDKFGKEFFVYKESEPYLKEYKKVGGITQFEKVVDVEVLGSYKVSGYTFVASLEYFPEIGKNIIKKTPNSDEIPEEFYTRTFCDHCKSNRFRKHTILLKNESDGTYVQVGKTCVKDYVGINAESYISYLSYFENMEEYLSNLCNDKSYRFSPIFYVKDVLEQAVARKNDFGYISKSTVDRWFESHMDDYVECPLTTTASAVFKIMNGVEENGEVLIKPYEISDSIKDEVNNILSFFEKEEESSDYIHNIKSIMELDKIDNSNLGLVVSMVGYYAKKMSVKKDSENAENKSEYVGKIGDRITLTSTPKCIFSAQSEFGYFFIYKFVVNGNEFIWKTSKELDSEKEITVKATIKAHSLFRSVKQTEVTRARIA